MVEVDVRGFSCPVPVVRTKKAMEQNPKEVFNRAYRNSCL
jgi:TusA-related sulfurtransferase